MCKEETIDRALDCFLWLGCVWKVRLYRQALLKRWRPVDKVEMFWVSDVLFTHYFGGLIRDRV